MTPTSPELENIHAAPARRHRSGRRWRVATIAIALASGGLIGALASAVPFSSETAQRKLIAALADRLDGDVELRELHIRVLPYLHAEGSGLTIRHRGVATCRR